jgi:hypothetical protein
LLAIKDQWVLWDNKANKERKAQPDHLVIKVTEAQLARLVIREKKATRD